MRSRRLDTKFQWMCRRPVQRFAAQQHQSGTADGTQHDLRPRLEDDQLVLAEEAVFRHHLHRAVDDISGAFDVLGVNAQPGTGL